MPIYPGDGRLKEWIRKGEVAAIHSRKYAEDVLSIHTAH